jgi:hypothetical protein
VKPDNEKNILFLDDDKERADAFIECYPQAVWVTCAKEAIDRLENHGWDEVWLDHDLEVGHGNGMDIVKALVEGQLCDKKFSRTFFVVHSWNVDAGEEMVRGLEDAGCNFVVHIPFAVLARVEYPSLV